MSEASQKGSNDFVTNVDKAAEAVITDTIRKILPTAHHHHRRKR
ncbi:hypothetical protein ACLK1T_20685 [Escherichia coli]